MKRFLISSALVLAVAAPVQAGDDPVKRLGRTINQYKDDKVQVAISAKYASAHLGEPWIFIDTWISAFGKPFKILREDVTLVTPDGTRLNLPSQKAMAQGIRDVAWLMKKATVSREPMMAYFVGREKDERLGFFAVPGEDIVFDEVTVNYFTVTHGDLFFHVKNGVFGPGKYRLEIYNKDADVRLPFEMPPAEKEKGDERPKDKDGKTVPW